MTLARDDEAVYLGTHTTQLIVVDQFKVVRADIVIGLDVISALGGVHVGYTGDKLTSVVFGERTELPPVVASSTGTESQTHPLSHVAVSIEPDGDVILSTADGSVRWLPDKEYWELTWNWKDNADPSHHLESGIGEYARTGLTKADEELFSAEVDTWNSKGYLVKHDPAVHGAATSVLPLIAKVQKHKSSTPVRPCLDYRELNKHIISHPGLDAPACGEALRKWRQAGEADQYRLLDISKAYLQVRIHPRFETTSSVRVAWRSVHHGEDGVWPLYRPEIHGCDH